MRQPIRALRLLRSTATQSSIFWGGVNEMLLRWGFIQGFDKDGSDTPDQDYLVPKGSVPGVVFNIFVGAHLRVRPKIGRTHGSAPAEDTE